MRAFYEGMAMPPLGLTERTIILFFRMYTKGQADRIRFFFFFGLFGKSRKRGNKE